MKRRGSAEGRPVDDAAPRVLVVDDSPTLRALVADVLEQGGCHVVGRVMDGAMALRYVDETHPDVVVCDIEMPRMDGLTFLRIVAQTSATPVIVLTSHGRPENALAALDAGAREFVIKPSQPEELRSLAEQLLAAIRALTVARRRDRQPDGAERANNELVDVGIPASTELVVIGTSTGGPRALRELVGHVTCAPRIPIVIAQHMPPRFTGAFAERLARLGGLDIAEATDGATLAPGQIRIGPGGVDVVVERAGGGLRTRLRAPPTSARWTPSVDELFVSAAAACGDRVLGIVLTGMGRDGSDGARALRDVGAALWTESPTTAAIEGMPASAARSHGRASVAPLDVLGQALQRLLKVEVPRDASSGPGDDGHD
jgi:two-component system chemotaxis response regulator CheB